LSIDFPVISTEPLKTQPGFLEVPLIRIKNKLRLSAVGTLVMKYFYPSETIHAFFCLRSFLYWRNTWWRNTGKYFSKNRTN